MWIRPHRSDVMRQPPQSDFSPSPGPRAGTSAVVGAFGVVGLFFLVLVAVSYPVVTGTFVLGAVSVPVARRAYAAVDGFRSRHAGARRRSRTDSTPRPQAE